MAKTRVPIPQDLASRVLFASDRTCCVCRRPERKIEIHHIDGDPSNNAFSNLAVVCKDCQSDAHTNHSFARNLTPETVLLYNDSWRLIVASRLNPFSSVETLSYRIVAFSDIASTIGRFMTMVGLLAHTNGHEWVEKPEAELEETYRWELDIEYSPTNWNSYLRLYERDIPNLLDRLERLVLIYADAIPVSLKAEVMTLSRVMRSECGQYLSMRMEDEQLSESDRRSMFRFRFVGLMGTIRRAEKSFRNACDVASLQREAATESTKPSDAV